MGADDFWAGFGADAKEWSKIIAGTILQRGAEKRTEERQVRAEDRAVKTQKSAERRKFLYGVDAAKIEADIGQSFWEAQKRYELEMGKQEAVATAELHADLEEGFGNINTARAIDALAETDPDMAERIIQGVQDIKEDKDIEDLSMFGVLGESAGPILEAYAIKKANRTERDRILKDSVAKRSYQKTMEAMMKAQTDMFEKTAETKGAIDPTKYASAQEKLLNLVKEIKESRPYINLQKLANEGKLEGNELLDYQSWQGLMETANRMSQSLRDIYYNSAGIDLMELEKERYRKLEEEIAELTKARGKQMREGVDEFIEKGETLREMLAPREEDKEVRREKMRPGGEKPFDYLKLKREDGKSFAGWIKDLFTKGKAEVPDDKKEDFQAFVLEVIAKATENLA